MATRRVRSGVLGRGAALAVMWAAVAVARADDARPLPASPLLPPDHWAVAAVERLHEVGLLPEWMPAQRAVPIAAVARALAEATDRADRESKAYAPIAHAWRERFAAEWSRAADLEAAPATLLGASASVGYEGSAVTTVGPASTRPAALLLGAAESRAAGSARAAATAGEHLAVGADVHVTATDITLRSGEVLAGLGPVQLSIGRAPVGYGPNQIGAVVASGSAALDRVELMTTEPIRLPWLDALGEFALDTAVARFSEARHPYTPLLWVFDLQWRPHPRLTLGALRGVMFGGALWDGISARQVPLALLGVQNYRENNVYSGTVQYRLPSEALLPLTAKLEWGTDDEPAAAWKWPALVVGLAAPMLPGVPAALGVEYAYFGKGIGPPHTPFAWYSHGQYVGGWATGETPLGDALGGNGRALRVVASADPWGPRIRVAASAWVADRFVDNLYAPQAAGRSVGGMCDAELRLGRTALGVRGSYERGRGGWSRAALSATTTAFF